MQTQYNDPKGAAGALKVPLGLIPPHAMEQTAWVHKFGAERYGAWNWRETGVCASTYVNAILRHLNAWRDGEDLDPESGISHLAHVACSANILMDAEYCGKLQDDRNTTRQCNEVEEAYDDWWESAKRTCWKNSFAAEKLRRQKRPRSQRSKQRSVADRDAMLCSSAAIFSGETGEGSPKVAASYEEDWGSLDEEKEDLRVKLLKSFFKLDKYAEAGVEDNCPEAGYRILKEDEELQDGDEVYIGEGHWCPVYVASWATPSIVYRGTYRRKITKCDLKDQQSCPECDALASYVSNDGPCDYHKNKTCDSKPEPQLKVVDCDLEEECKCGRRYVYHWPYGWICEDCDLKLSDYYP